MPVQWVNRPNLDFRGYSGTIASGVVRPGDPVGVSGLARTTTVQRIVTMDGDLAEARAGDAVTLVLEGETDISRGDVLAAADAPVQLADQFQTPCRLALRDAADARPHLSLQARHARR